MGMAAQALEEGNPLDRTIFFILILLAVGISSLAVVQLGRFLSRAIWF